jgi:superfamily II DNA helicase RecQ
VLEERGTRLGAFATTYLEYHLSLSNPHVPHQILHMAVLKSSSMCASDDEFDLSSSDEAELLELTTIAESSSQPRGTKRKGSPVLDERPAKIQSFEINQKLAPLTLKILKTNFGLTSFRLKQAQAVDRLLGGDSAVVVFPTGGGKSLCYQLPAVAFSEIDELDNVRQEGNGITLVVSPLIALMKDQTDALRRRGIKAASLDSSKSREEYLRIHDMMREGELKLLYVAPERLNNEGFVSSIAQVRGGVRMVAVVGSDRVHECQYLSDSCIG